MMYLFSILALMVAIPQVSYAVSYTYRGVTAVPTDVPDNATEVEDPCLHPFGEGHRGPSPFRLLPLVACCGQLSYLVGDSCDEVSAIAVRDHVDDLVILATRSLLHILYIHHVGSENIQLLVGLGV